MNSQTQPIRDARTLGIPKMLLLGLQHMFAMFGATILVPILVNNYFEGEGLSVQVTLICAGLGTLFFHMCSKLKIPAFLGSSFAFLGGFETVSKLDQGIFAGMSMGEKLPYACGGIVVAGGLYLVLALVIKAIGVRKVMRFLPPVVTGPIIICIGLSLAPTAVTNASGNWLLALIALATIIVFNIWGKGMFKIIPILMGVVVSYLAALIMNAAGMTNADGSAILNFAAVHSANWVGLPPFELCKFNITSVLVMAPIALATMMVADCPLPPESIEPPCDVITSNGFPPDIHAMIAAIITPTTPPPAIFPPNPDRRPRLSSTLLLCRRPSSLINLSFLIKYPAFVTHQSR